MLDLTPKFPVLSFEQEVVLPDDLGSAPGDTIGGWQARSGELAQGKVRLQASSERILIGDATAPTTGTGIFMGSDGSTGYDFRVGNPSGSYLHWDESAGTLTLVGSLTATSGTIGGFTIGADYIRDAADSMGLASTVSGSDDVRFWAGAAFASRASAPFRVTEAGAVTASSLTVTGGSISGTPIASIPNNSSTDISLLNYTHDLVFSVTDADTVAWASGTITMSNGRTFSITASNTGNMAARTYVYLDTGVSTTALQTTTTVSTAMGANKILIAVAQNGSGQPTYQVYGGIGGLKIGSSGVNISNNNWTFSGTWSVTDLNTIAWGSGTLKVSDGTSYSITGSNTGNMAAKTYIYFDLGTSSTAFQTTTTATTAIGDGKILIAIAQNGTGEANYIVMNDKAHNIDAANIVAGSITANELAAGSVTATKISVTNLAAISADLGTITAGTVTGATIRTASSGTRFEMTSTAFQGINSGGTVIFEVVISGANAGDVIMGDDATGKYMQWDNSAGILYINGTDASTVVTGASRILTGSAGLQAYDDAWTETLSGSSSITRSTIVTRLQASSTGGAAKLNSPALTSTVFGWDDDYTVIFAAHFTGDTASGRDARFIAGLAESATSITASGADPAITTRHALFYRKEDGTLVASVGNGTSGTESTISGVTLSTLNTFRIDYNGGANVLFYVNDVLKATISATLPSGTSNPPTVLYQTNQAGGGGSDSLLNVGNAIVFIDP